MLFYIRERATTLRVIDLHEYDKFYLQLKLLMEHNKKQSPFSWQNTKNTYNEHIDKFFKDEDLIERLEDGFQMLKSIGHLLKASRVIYMDRQ